MTLVVHWNCVWISTVCVDECTNVVDGLCFVYLILLSADNFCKCSKLFDYHFGKFSRIRFIVE